MKELVGVNFNVFHLKNKDESVSKLYEMIIMVQEPKYELNNEQDLIRKRQIEDFRFFIQEKNYDKFMNLIREIRDQEESQDKING